MCTPSFMQGPIQSQEGGCARRRPVLACRRPVSKPTSRTRSRTAGLRAAIACLPRETREGMLAALDEEVLLTGAYSSRDGGLCPMAAAHRRGPRGDAHAFARAWDRFCAIKPG